MFDNILNTIKATNDIRILDLLNKCPIDIEA